MVIYNKSMTLKPEWARKFYFYGGNDTNLSPKARIKLIDTIFIIKLHLSLGTLLTLGMACFIIF